MGGHLDACFEICWEPDFTKLRKILAEEITNVEYKKRINAEGDDLDLFFRDSEDTTPRCEVEVWKDFCRGVSIAEVDAGTGAAGHDRVVWLDERTCGPKLAFEGHGDARPHPTALTATGLYRALSQPRFDHPALPDAARRLIYTTLNPACVYALAVTALSHQTPILRKAIYKHLAFQTSIAVNIPSAGVLTFQLDLHLPFFLLRKETPPTPVPAGKIYTKPKRRWSDLSFLNPQDFTTTASGEDSQSIKEKEVWGIHEAQISVVITGTDDWRWVGYGFVDAEVDGVLADCSSDDLLFDQIAAGQLQANFPTWKPRDYWLRVFEVRIAHVRKEWDDLAHKLEHDIGLYMTEHPVTLSQRSKTSSERAAELRESFDWMSLTMDLLRRLDGVLSATVKAWESFDREDIGYFRDIEVHGQRSLRAIRATFRELQKHEENLQKMSGVCSNFSRNLELRLYHDSKESADQSEVTSELSFSVLYPIALAAAIFSMQQGALPFELTTRAFILTVVLLIVMVHVVRFARRHTLSRWPLLRRTVGLWLRREKINKGEDVKEPPHGSDWA